MENEFHPLVGSLLRAALSVQVVPFAVTLQDVSKVFRFTFPFLLISVQLRHLYFSLCGCNRGRRGWTEAETDSMVVKCCLSLCRAQLWKRQVC